MQEFFHDDPPKKNESTSFKNGTLSKTTNWPAFSGRAIFIIARVFKKSSASNDFLPKHLLTYTHFSLFSMSSIFSSTQDRGPFPSEIRRNWACIKPNFLLNFRPLETCGDIFVKNSQSFGVLSNSTKQKIMTSFRKINIWGTLGVCFGCVLTASFAEAQHFSADSYRSGQPSAEEEMTVGEMLAGQQTAQVPPSAVQMPSHAVGNDAPEMQLDDSMPTDWDAVSANVGRNTPQTVSRSSAQHQAQTQLPTQAQAHGLAQSPAVSEVHAVTASHVPAADPVRQMSYDAPHSGTRDALPAAGMTRSQQRAEPIRLAAHETAVQTQTVSAGPASAAAAEPAQLPDDYPTGEMAPLDPQDLIAFSETVNLAGGPIQQITIIDPLQKVLCVYHISMTTGQIELKSARKVEWDLQLIFLNSRKPLPQDVQAIIEQNRRRR